MQCKNATQLQATIQHHYRYYHPSYLIKKPHVTTRAVGMLADLPHKVEVELARVTESLALHDTGDHAVTDGAEVGDGREVIEDDSGRDQALIFHATEL